MSDNGYTDKKYRNNQYMIHPMTTTNIEYLIKAWMANTSLKLNPFKTELMWFGTRHGLNKLRPAVLGLTLRP